MERIVEPELMDEEEQARAYAEGDFAEPHERFVSLFRETFGELPRGNVLDLGCGSCDVLVRFARANPRVLIHGVDGSAAMLRHAKVLLSRSGTVARRIELFRGMLSDVSMPRPRYDAVISNSLLHHLHNPLVLWRTVRRYAADGAPIFAMDLRRPPSMAAARDLVTTYAAAEPPVLQRDFFNSLVAAFTPEEIEGQLAVCGLGNLEVRELGDRHVLVVGNYLSST